MTTEERSERAGDPTVCGSLSTTCERGCPDACGLVATVSEGRVVQLRGDPQHPVTRGCLCAQGNRYLRRQYAADRLLYPMRRTPTGWERVSWGTALNLIAERLLAVREHHGSQAVLVVDYGLPGWVNRAVLELFWRRFGGVTTTRGGLSMESAVAAQYCDLGTDGTHDAADFLNARAIVTWGANPYVTHQHWACQIAAARKRGAMLVAIDPLNSSTARRADAHYRLRPGSDGWLALGVARLLLERGEVDAELIMRRSEGFGAYHDLLKAYESREIAQRTGLASAELEALADLYGRDGPVATIIGHGPSYWENGGAQVRLIDALVAVSGNLGVRGGGASTDVTRHPLFGVSTAGDVPDRDILLPRLGDEILAASDPPLRFGWVAGANPAASVANAGRVAQGLRSLEFLVVVEQFMTATAQLADIVLPCATFLEADDLVTTYGHQWVSLKRRVIAPAGESKPDAEILQALADRLGFGPELAGSAREWISRLVEPAGPALSLEALERTPQLDPRAVSVPFADGRFATSSRRFRFIQTFQPSQPLPLETSQLHLLAPKTRLMMNSQILPEDLPDEACVRVNPQTAGKLGFTDGEIVLVRSGVGEVRARLMTDSNVHPEVALMVPSLWRGDLSGVNRLREGRLTDMGECVAFNETRVTIARCEL